MTDTTREAVERLIALYSRDHGNPTFGEKGDTVAALRGLLTRAEAAEASLLATCQRETETILRWENRLEAAEAELKEAKAKISMNPFDDSCHFDDHAVNRFSVHMKSKLASKRAQGRGGWHEPQVPNGYLSRLLREHVEKGDPVDVANLAMMIHQRGETIAKDNDGATCDAIDRAEAERDALAAKLDAQGRELNRVKYGEPDFAWSIHKAAMADLQAKLALAVEALERLARLGNGDKYGNSDGNMIARIALALIEKETGQ